MNGKTKQGPGQESIHSLTRKLKTGHEIISLRYDKSLSNIIDSVLLDQPGGTRNCFQAPVRPQLESIHSFTQKIKNRN